jgi:hypothetical protein
MVALGAVGCITTRIILILSKPDGISTAIITLTARAENAIVAMIRDRLTWEAIRETGVRPEISPTLRAQTAEFHCLCISVVFFFSFSTPRFRCIRASANSLQVRTSEFFLFHTCFIMTSSSILDVGNFFKNSRDTVFKHFTSYVLSLSFLL